MTDEPAQLQSVIDHHTRTIIDLCKATGEMMHPDLCKELRNYMPGESSATIHISVKPKPARYRRFWPAFIGIILGR